MAFNSLKDKDKVLSKEELAEKKRNRKGAFVFILIIAIMVPVI